MSTSGIIFLAIKPQQFVPMVSSLHNDVDKTKIHRFVSVMAGVTIKNIKEVNSVITEIIYRFLNFM